MLNTFTLFWLRKTSVVVKLFQWIFCVFMCAFHPEISSFLQYFFFFSCFCVIHTLVLSLSTWSLYSSINVYNILLIGFQVNVVVEDENDNGPVFDRSSYEGHVEENSPGGTEVILDHLIHATDADMGNNAQFTFTLHGDGSEMFTIDRITGRVFVKGLLLDREEKSVYLLQVVARDKG